MILFLGCFAFILMIFYDFNQIKFHFKIGKLAFAAGSLLLMGVTVFIFVSNFDQLVNGNMYQYICLFISFIFFILLLYTLFFALPFDDTYIEQNKGKVYDQGVYSLCRHPGVLWFFISYLFLAFCMASQQVLYVAIVFSLLNLIYAYIQDKVIFPIMLEGYQSYQNRVPFLIPNKNSILEFCHKQ
ncbi:MAG: hypothetical protein RSA06_04920 [Erysipelotrichaceae bacterium]